MVSYHTNPYTCGVARFNHSLARVMNVPLRTFDDFLEGSLPQITLLSIKLEEINSSTLALIDSVLTSGMTPFALLLHGTDGSERERRMCDGASRVFAASAEIAESVRKVRPDVVPVFAPGAPVLSRQMPADCTLLTFGMAHKIRSDGYRKLASLMRGDSRTFSLEISTALHEGGTFDENFFVVGEEISSAFGGSVRFLGFLADAEVSERLRRVDALVAFFARGVRENNTTVLSAMTHGCAVVTNLDDNSPSWMIHAETVFDINKLARFPGKAEIRAVGEAGMKVASEFSFERLAEVISSS